MITVRFSKRKDLVLPESLGHTLGLREGDRVEVHRHNNMLWLQRKDTLPSPGPLTDLTRIVSSSRPAGSVNVEKYMSKQGYEQVDDRFNF